MADVVEALPPPPPPERGGGGGGSGRSSPSPAASPEFEFWMVGKNPSPALLTADELFSGGVVLPLRTLQPSTADGEGGAGEEGQDSSSALARPDAAEAAQPLAESGVILPTPDLPAVTFKWKDIFKAAGGGGGETNKERKKMERRTSSVSGNAELININIWPFSRSRSAGHSAGSLSLSRAKPNPSANANASGSCNGVVVANASTASAPVSAPAPTGRKVSSAPCSRSNSRGESGPEPTLPAAIPPPAAAAAGEQAAPLPGPTSMLRRLVPGHGRSSINTAGAGGAGAPGGIRLGRPSPVWQLRRNKLQQTAAEHKQATAKMKKKAAAPAAAAGDDKAAAGCRNDADGGGAAAAAEEGPNPPQQGPFGLRTFFSKKVY